MKHLIILDTNVIRSDFLLNSNTSKILISFLEKTSSKLVIPKLVFQELTSLYKKELESQLNDLNKSIERLNRMFPLLEGTDFRFNINIEGKTKNYIEHLKEKLSSHLIEIEYHDSFLPELVRRQIERIKPVSSRGEEFRDALLWLTILKYMGSLERESRISFITNNVSDFGNNEKNDLHPDLSKEVQNLKTKVNVKLYFYKSLNDFTKQIAVKLNSINEDWLLSNMNWEEVKSNAMKAVHLIDPHYFYEYYYSNELSENELEGWDIIHANFYESITEFYVYELIDTASYVVHILLNGIVEIEFETNKEEFIQKEIEFGSTLYVTIEKMKIKSSEGYFPEETGLEIKAL